MAIVAAASISSSAGSALDSGGSALVRPNAAAIASTGSAPGARAVQARELELERRAIHNAD
jgi:hypothetical protein